MSRTIRLTGIFARAEQIAVQLQRLSFATTSLDAGQWQPAVNVYVYSDRLEVCMDLAGVRKEDIHVEVDAGRLVIRGHRDAPLRSPCEQNCARILIMEIPEGSFERILQFRQAIDPDRVSARQEEGFLWVTLPKAQTGGES